MNKAKLIREIVEYLRLNNKRKSISIPKQVFKISTAEGQSKDFSVKPKDKDVAYTIDDVGNIVDAMWDIIEESLKKGEEVSFFGYGTFRLNYRQKRGTKIPGTDEWVEVKARHVPKFSFGAKLSKAARLYDQNLEDKELAEKSFEKNVFGAAGDE